MNRKLGILYVALAGLACADEWERLGSRMVQFAGEKDAIDCTGEGAFQAIKIEVDDGNLEMYNIKIHFRNGESFSPDTRLNFRQGERSRTIDLPGENRVIQKIDFWYQSKGQKGRATVTVFGKRTGGGKPSGGDKPVGSDKPSAGGKASGGWEFLGDRWVDFSGEKDVISVTGSEGMFRAIKLEVDGGNLDLYNIRVNFRNGESFSPDTRLEFKQGSTSRSIDLPGDARVIRDVEFWYRSEVKRGRAKLSLYGSQASSGQGETGSGEGRWEVLGRRNVNLILDRDVISAAGEGRFNAIRIDVKGGNIDLYNLKVTFVNGETYSPDTRFEFRQGSSSRDIDLPGEARGIKSIEFWYRSEFQRGEAEVVVSGRHAGDAPSTGKGEGASPKDPKDRFPGWEHLGSRVVDYGRDKDRIDCRGEGRFSSFTVEVENGDLELYDLVVTFANGETASPKVRLSFDSNTRTRVIDLPGKERAIKHIDFFYKSVAGTRDGRATVNVYGKR